MWQAAPPVGTSSYSRCCGARDGGSAQILGIECEPGRKPASELSAAGCQVEWPTPLFLDHSFFPSFGFWDLAFFFLALRGPPGSFINK